MTEPREPTDQLGIGATDMTDRTHPDSGFPIAYSHYATYTEYVEALHARIAVLEAQLEAIGAGGVSGPLMGQPQEMPDLSALTERGAKAWAGVDAQGLREGFTAADMATASAQGFRDGVASAQQPAKAESLRQILTDPENQPNQFGVQFLMHGAKMAFRIGNRQFCLDYEPDEPGEFEFMRDALISAFSIFTPDVKLAQQPATHVQNPAEIAHVAGDVSKNGPESNMKQQPAPSAAVVVNPDPHAELRKTWQPGQRWQARSFRNGQWGPWTDAVASEPFWFPHQDYRRHPDDLAPQPAPTAQAASSAVLKAIREANMQLVRTGDDAFMLVTYKNAKAQCDGGQCGIGGYCDDCPTPKADSQPAPDEVADAMADSQYLAGVSAGWNAANADDPNAALQKLHESRAGYLKPLSAARAPADSVTAPAGGPAMPAEFLRGVIALCTQRGYSPENIEAWSKDDKWIADLWRQAERLLAAAPTPPAQAADSVLEDAARYRWLRDEGFTFADVDLGTDSDGDDFVAYRIRFHLPEPAHSKFEDDDWTGPDIDAAIDAAMKAGGAR